MIFDIRSRRVGDPNELGLRQSGTACAILPRGAGNWRQRQYAKVNRGGWRGARLCLELRKTEAEGAVFFKETAEWQAVGAGIVEALTVHLAQYGFRPDQLGLALVSRGPQGAEGFAHRGDWACYPCSLVKAFHLVHALAALDEGRIVEEPELTRALADMILWSSNTATNYVIDTVTGTTGDTLLQGAEWMDFTVKRGRLNGWFQALDWPEFAGCSITQKLMDDTRYGREAQFAGADGENLNVLTPLAAARVLWELFDGDLPLSDASRLRAQDILRRSSSHPQAATPAYQLTEYLGGDLPQDLRIWSKAGHNLWTGEPKTSWYKHDMLRAQAPSGRALIMVVMTQG
ncbi:MAG: serine hydrolase, partial [Cypionkella sp.]|nr:serine hydrolase [Cypionkella sp.]